MLAGHVIITGEVSRDTVSTNENFATLPSTRSASYQGKSGAELARPSSPTMCSIAGDRFWKPRMISTSCGQNAPTTGRPLCQAAKSLRAEWTSLLAGCLHRWCAGNWLFLACSPTIRENVRVYAAWTTRHRCALAGRAAAQSLDDYIDIFRAAGRQEPSDPCLASHELFRQPGKSKSCCGDPTDGMTGRRKEGLLLSGKEVRDRAWQGSKTIATSAPTCTR